ncbi:hypothetical protein [Halodesulfovibrio aestuarii]|uniref:Uncharacterized protein n=1 Tax=Halodesulfovibrio aestuarii TaxID=126333 RepID=A0A8G2FAQ2_9BACT|nr:hypothetical protein [Halodesulfovibrio aestuarii]SHJ06783.1 hypothetical protein SAMN05660830_01538 [Halodesulfovibrio aestuarii]
MNHNNFSKFRVPLMDAGLALSTIGLILHYRTDNPFMRILILIGIAMYCGARGYCYVTENAPLSAKLIALDLVTITGVVSLLYYITESYMWELRWIFLTSIAYYVTVRTAYGVELTHRRAIPLKEKIIGSCQVFFKK